MKTMKTSRDLHSEVMMVIMYLHPVLDILFILTHRQIHTVEYCTSVYSGSSAFTIDEIVMK